MDLFGYIKNYGNFSFSERTFNEVDNVIFSCLSYVNLFNIVSGTSKNKITMKEAGEKYFQIYNKKEERQNVSEMKLGVRVLKSVMNTKRYQDVLVYNYLYVSSSRCQFGAVSFDLSNDLVYIAYEGTDHLLSGWLEDCEIAYHFPVQAQSLAIKYLNHNFRFSKKKILLGGHSKGGNLAITAAMYASFFVKRRIEKIYSNDGFGLKKEEYQSKRYQKIEKKIKLFIADYSIVAFLLYNKSKFTAIETTKKSQLCHNPMTWKVAKNRFVRGSISKSSKVLTRSIHEWSNMYPLKEKIEFVEEVFQMLRNHSIESLRDVKKNKKLILKIILGSKEINQKGKEMFKTLYKTIKDCNKKYNNEEKWL